MSNYTISSISKEHLDKFWSQISPLLHAGLLMCEGELDINQLRLLCVQGSVNIIVAVDNDTGYIKGALALELVRYPNFRAANIISYGGYDLFADLEDFNSLKMELKRAGISQLQGWCKPAQARLFKSKYGFSTPYEMIRVSLGEGE